MPARFFVYGTLMSPYGNSRLFEGVAGLVGRASVRGKLHRVAWFPGLVEGDRLVHGELWESVHEVMDEEVIRRLDRLEGYDPRARWPCMYVRREVEVLTPFGDPFGLTAWTYYWNSPLRPKDYLIESGDFNQEVEGTSALRRGDG
jgi:gamma-glutamylcyclotransferase (GGCT)/AIG2-like uncharacterized protein YtfP